VNPLCILIASDTYYPQIDGTSYFTQRLAAGLAAKGHHVHVVCPADTILKDVVIRHGASLHPMPSFLTPFHPTQRVCLSSVIKRLAAQLVQELSPDVIHVQGHFPICRTLIQIARRLDIPLIATNHFMPQNLVPYYLFPEWCRGRVESTAWRDLVRWFRYPQIVTTPTDTAAQVLWSHGVNRPVTVISGGVDTHRFVPADISSTEARRRLNLANRATILYVGRLSADKGISDLIEALPIVRQRVDAQLIIAGRGVRAKMLLRHCHTLGVAQYVNFLGFVPNAEIPRVYMAADVFCMPGRAELQSLATLEALSTALPVIAADAVALPHLVINGVNGFLYEPRDICTLSKHICSVLEAPRLRQTLGQASRQIALSHDIGLTVEQYEQTYNAAVSGKERS